ncbi:hypothetical protein MSG28_001632 [Choristoneura fumiferana]|uniref:Uncharacterized protein n=1 Tax=Choristoneura fumiferana TaxID=7141 RepID=A0ACC0KVD2_CHOFU|nr:hypothetical protein MSG28_001632 [Choristoneura fumiferana]
MSETALTESNSLDPLVPADEDVKFPPLPEPRDVDFDEDISEDERTFYKTKFNDLNWVTSYRLHCTACDRHLGCSATNESRMRAHPMLRTLMCNTCFAFYNSGEFEKGDDGSELYCRWCGQGGQVYCCADCPHVFCAKCIKRNLGIPKIKEIENTDDWKCFKCNNRPLWDLRAACWALLRYCDLRNRITMATQDQALKEKYQVSCATDYTECCKHKKRREKIESNKKREEKKEAENSAKKAAAAVISKIPPTIQVKKFASINVDDVKQEKKPVKRSISPKNKTLYLKNPIAVSSPKSYGNSMNVSTYPKKIRLSSSPIINPVRFVADRKQVTTPIRIRPKGPTLPIPIMTPFNGYNNVNTYNNFINDNINLSLENLTQGLDMAAVASMNNNGGDDDVVCTPDFPMEPLCEVTEDNTDDDVQCITPAPKSFPRISNPPPLVPRLANTLPDLSAENIVQMTENDVTVNAQTGGLKFRVDPQTLSSNKMYRLPDGRIFAINANPNMPGGYSATIVAVTETASKTAPKGATYAAKLSAVTPQAVNSTPKPVRIPATRSGVAKRKAPNTAKVTRGTETVSRECDLDVPIEWYRHNLIDAIDALDYSMSRLNKLRKEATTVHLRTRTVGEMKVLHKTLERLLQTSNTRFNEIRDNLSKGFKQYLVKKAGGSNGTNNISDDDDDDDDDDVEILPNPEENDDPIFIDENSVDSNANDTNSIDQQEVDLTGAMSSGELNESGEKAVDMNNVTKVNEEMQDKSSEQDDTISKAPEDDPLANTEMDHSNENNNDESEPTDENQKSNQNVDNKESSEIDDDNNENESHNEKEISESDSLKLHELNDINGEEKVVDSNAEKHNEENIDDSKVASDIADDKTGHSEISKNDDGKNDDSQENDNDSKLQDTEMSEEMIETLLKDDDGVDDDNTETSNNMDTSEGV